MDKRITRMDLMDADGFIALFEAHKAGLFRVARGYFRNIADAEDAVAETALHAWDKRKTLRDPERFRAWATSILINICKDMLRRQKRVVLVAEFPEDSAEAPQDVELETILNTLSDRIRPVMVLYYAEGFRTEEIARMLRLPKGTVTSRLKRGREQLAVLWEKEGV